MSAFDAWIAGQMDRGLSPLEVDQMRAAFVAGLDCAANICEPLVIDEPRSSAALALLKIVIELREINKVHEDPRTPHRS